MASCKLPNKLKVIPSYVDSKDIVDRLHNIEVFLKEKKELSPLYNENELVS